MGWVLLGTYDFNAEQAAISLAVSALKWLELFQVQIFLSAFWSFVAAFGCP
jgi:hypothetical protein